MLTKNEIESYNLRFLLISSLISSLIIAIFYNLNIDYYLKGFIIPITTIFINFLINIKKNNLLKNKKAFLLIIPISLIILSSILFKTFNNRILNIFILPMIIIYCLFSLINKKYDLTSKILILFFKVFPTKYFSNLNYLNNCLKPKSNKKYKSLNILLGLVISIPLAIILLSLLASSDMYFSTFINNIFSNFLNIFNIHFLWSNLYIFSLTFIAGFSIFINILRKKDIVDTKSKSFNVNESVMTTILVVINLVFVLFLISEISKLTTNFLQIPIEYTYSEYAREGFFQLLVVTTINIIITFFCLYKTNLVKENKTIKYLIFLLTIFSIILIFNSYYRMYLYINAYSFTTLRLQVILFLLLELILFSLIIYKLLKGLNYNNFKIYFYLAITFYIINLYLASEPIVNMINRLLN